MTSNNNQLEAEVMEAKTVNINGCYCKRCVKETQNHVPKITGKGLKKS